MLHGNVKTFDVILKKLGEESTLAVELALDGHSLFISGQKDTFTLTHQRAASDLIIIDRRAIASYCIDVSKHKQHEKKKTVGNLFLVCLNFSILFFLKETVSGLREEGGRENQVRFNYKKYQRDKV